jgi:hypothetical protein
MVEKASMVGSLGIERKTGTELVAQSQKLYVQS